MKQDFIIAYRYFIKKPVFSIITFGGFTIGMAACLLIYFWVHHELSYDRMHSDYQDIYRVLKLSKKGDNFEKSPGSYRPLASSFKADYPQIEWATYISYSSESSPLQVEDTEEKIEAKESWTNSDFFRIFTGFTFVEGKPETAFNDPVNVVISQDIAHKLFGSNPALGKKIIVDKYGKTIYRVGAVVAIPNNSHVGFDYLLSEKNAKVKQYASSWSDSYYIRSYIKLAANSVIDDDFLSNISNQITRYTNRSEKILFQPLTDIHLYSDYEDNLSNRPLGNYTYVWLFSGLAFLILVMAIFNFSVLSIARASERTTEIGIKKVSGASRWCFIRQFIGESVIQTILASLIALVLINLLLPWFQQFTGKTIYIEYTFSLILNLGLIVLLTGLFAGVYPTLYLSSLKPNQILKKAIISGAPNKLMKSLVVFQFVITMGFLISSSVFIKQIHFIQSQSEGINHDNIIVIPTGLWYSNRGFKDELLKNPSVISASAGYAPVNFKWQLPFSLNHLGRTDSLYASLLWVDEDFAKTYQLELIKGQFLGMDYSAYWKEWKNKHKQESGTAAFPIVINQKAEEILQLEDPIGSRIGNLVIVGVVKDFYFRTAHHPIGPVILTNDPQNIGMMNVKISPSNRAETIEYIRDTYQKYRNGREFSYHYFNDLLAKEYAKELFMKRITLLFTVLAILISMLGILGMSWFSVERRTKEIGIHKVNGANTFHLMYLLNIQFVKNMVVAYVIASPIAWYVMNNWLENFAYKTEISWWIFALSGIFALSITLITVSWQSWKAATKNPVEALRYE